MLVVSTKLNSCTCECISNTSKLEKKLSKIYPKIMLKTEITPRYIKSDFFPNIEATTPIVTEFVAGPALRNTKTAPLLMPLNKNAAAIGRDAVAQTYSGKLTISIAIYVIN